jgi:Polyketide cyclase / dehydrase and lipid transport
MKIVMRIFLVIFLLIGGLLAYATTKPDSFRVERSIDIKASPAKIFPYVNDLRKGPEWSPWEKTDPQMKRTYNGPVAGKGAGYAWDGNKEAGKGKMTITESVENQKVIVALHFDEPMVGDNVVEYILTPKGDQTNVKWAMGGPMPFISKVICIFMDMDKMIGGQFEKGLQSLKTVAEK